MKAIKTILCTLMILLCTNVSAQNISGTWTGVLNVGMQKLHVVFNINKDKSGKDVCTMDSPDQSAKGIPAELAHVSADSISVKISAAAIEYNGKLQGDSIKGVFTQMGMNFPLNLKKEKIVYNRPQNPTQPYPYTTEEVKFFNNPADAILRGTLTYPVGYKEGDKVPVVLMVTGSGAQNRDEELFEHKPFLVIADYLARHGIASLRYDDRGVGGSTAKSVTINTKEVVDDARCGINYLRSKKRFSKVGLLGHSEGGSVAFILGAEDALDFAVSMAGSGANGIEVLYSQSKIISESLGKPFPMTKEMFIDYIRNMNNPWMNYFLDYDPVNDIKNTTCPVLAINGDKDMQVIASLNLEAIKNNLPENKNTVTKLYPGLNHLFQPCNTGHPNEYVNIETTISEEVMNDIVRWINDL